MKKIFFIAIVLMFGLGHAQDAPIETPKILIKIPLGETTQINNTLIKFLEVLEDSRCPKYTNCVRAGRVRIQVEIKTGEAPVVLKEIIFGETNPGESIDKSISNAGEVRLVGDSVIPYPEMDDEGKRSYALLISKVK